MVFWRKKAKPDQVEDQLPAVEVASMDESASDAEPESSSEEKASGIGWFAKLKSALKKTNQVLRTDIRDLWKSDGRLVDEEFLKEFFTILVRCDMGQATANRIRDRIATDFRGRKVEMNDVLEKAREEVRSAMQNHSVAIQMAEQGPTVILVVGVNGRERRRRLPSWPIDLRNRGSESFSVPVTLFERRRSSSLRYGRNGSVARSFAVNRGATRAQWLSKRSRKPATRTLISALSIRPDVCKLKRT